MSHAGDRYAMQKHTHAQKARFQKKEQQKADIKSHTRTIQGVQKLPTVHFI